MKTVSRANHPGRLLGRWLEDKGFSQRKFAELIGKSHVDVSNIINEKKDINVDFAIRIGLALGTSPDVRIGMQKAYDLYKTTQSDRKEEYRMVEQRVKSLVFA